VYAVTAHTLPKTYRYEANRSLLTLSVLLHPAALMKIGPTRHLMWASMLSYLGAARLDRAYSGLKAVRAGEALPAHRYLVVGYILLVPALLVSWLYPLDKLGILHTVLIGFVGLHIYALPLSWSRRYWE